MANREDCQSINERKSGQGSDTAPDAPELRTPTEQNSALSSATLEEIRALRRTTDQPLDSDIIEFFGTRVGTEQAEARTEQAEARTEQADSKAEQAVPKAEQSNGGADKAEASSEQTEQGLIDSMRRDLQQHGREPNGVLNQLMRDNQGILIGEGHGTQESQRIHGPDYLRSLAAGGATHLVIEAGPGSAEMLETFNRTGEIDPTKLPILLRDESFYNVLRTARELGLRIVPGDSEHRTSDDPNRDRTMADTIRGILNEPDQDPNNPNRVVFWVGSWHLNDFSDRPNRMSDGLAAEQLRRSGVSIATVGYEDGGENEYALPARAASSLTEPTIVSTREAQNIGNYEAPTKIANRNSADYIIFYPPRNR